MRRALPGLLILAILPWAFIGPAEASTPKVGGVCVKSGATSISGKIELKCAKSGKTLNWVRIVKNQTSTPSPTPTPSPSPSPTPTSPALDPVLTHLQDLITAVKLSDATFVPSLNAVTEDGPNGNWPSIAIDASKYALNFYSALGMIEKQSQVNVLLGRTQNWLHQESAMYAPNCVSSAYLFTGNASLCSANWATVYSHLPDAITSDARISEQADLSLISPARDRPYWPAMPHEIFHTYQQGKSSAIGLFSDSWPAWFREGSAQAMAYSAYQKYLGGNYLATLDISAQGEPGWGKTACTTGLQSLKPVCEYTEGFAASEYFLSRFGFNAYIDIFSKPGPSDFPGRFLMATGESLDAFYTEANHYLKSIGWASAS